VRLHSDQVFTLPPSGAAFTQSLPSHFAEKKSSSKPRSLLVKKNSLPSIVKQGRYSDSALLILSPAFFGANS
jgi:hypothetical protein